MVSHTSAGSAVQDTANSREAIVARLTERGVIAVVRLANADDASHVTAALLSGGVDAIEVTLTTSGALDAISALRKEFGASAIVGAGSVLNDSAARDAIDAGASYIVSPIATTSMIAVAHARNVLTMIGAFSPTEMHAVHAAHSDFVKLFPADTQGPSFLKGVLAPMPFLRVVPTGGISIENAGLWIAAGAKAVGAGASLVDPKLVAAHDWAALTSRAKSFIEAVRTARAAAQGVRA